MKLKKGVIIQKMGKTFVAYDNENSVMHELNEVGYLILSGLEKGKTKGEILRKVTREFKVTEQESRQDLEDFIRVLKKAKLIAGKR